MTLRMPVAALEGVHEGHDIWVVATGPSMNYVNPDFFNNKITVGVNDAYRRFDGLTYLLSKTPWGCPEHHDGKPPPGDARLLKPYWVGSGSPKLVLSEHDCGSTHLRHNVLLVPAYYFDHNDNNCKGEIDFDVVGCDNSLVVSWSTITSAIHLAAHLGAENIIVCGHDGGSIDGEWRMQVEGFKYPVHRDEEKLIPVWMRQTREVRDKLTMHYGCKIYGLNPFIGLGCPGHVLYTPEEV